MRRYLLATTMALAMAAPAHAITFNQSDFAGTGNFGTITAHFTDAAQTIVEVDVNVAPNLVLDTGSHWSLTLSLLGTGRIDQASLNPALFTAQAHHTTAFYSNSPFGDFNDAIAGACGSGGSSGGCGSSFSFLINNFQGFAPASGTFNGLQIYAAADVLLTNCTGGCTGVVGAAGVLTPTPFDFPPSATPGPIVGTGLPGLLAAGFGLLGLNWNRRRRRGEHLPT
jgi:hypothetical protein